MKNIHQNILILVVLSLCALCIYQWNDETRQRAMVNDLNTQISQKLAAIQEYTNSMRDMEGQIARMDAHITELQATIKTNQDLILSQKRELNKAEGENAALTSQIAEYKRAVGEFETRLKTAYDGIQKQNAVIKQLADQRNEFAQRLNDSIKDRNDVVLKYNKLAADFQKAQAPPKPQQ